MLKRIVHVSIASAVAFGLVMTSAQTADARGGRIAGGIAAGIIAGTVLGAYAYGAPRYYGYSSGPACYRGPRQCDWAGRSCGYNRYGEYACRGGEWRCWRPTICD